jgi:ligand-binding sensor domain-containing protein/serine phosphatase RsbU (regulator of sigma subunit)
LTESKSIKLGEIRAHRINNDSLDKIILDSTDLFVKNKAAIKKPEKKRLKTIALDVKETSGIIFKSPVYIVPGEDSIPLPKTVKAIDSSVIAGIPEVVTAKDPYVKKQNPYSFCSYNKLQGMNHSVFRSIIQDDNRNIWFGTDGGITKFNGKNFSHYTNQEGLSSNYTWSVYEDSKGNVWTGSRSGLCRFDGRAFSYIKGIEDFSNAIVLSVIEDSKGNMWFGTSIGLIKYTGDSLTHFTVNEGLIWNQVLEVFEDSKQNIWITTPRGLCMYDGKGFIHLNMNNGLIYNFCWAIDEDKSGNIWIGTWQGINKFDGTQITRFVTSDGIINDPVWDIKVDHLDNVWIATNGRGVLKFDGHQLYRFTTDEGLSDNVVTSILEDDCSSLWFGTFNGVNKYSGDVFVHYGKTEGFADNAPLSVIKDIRNNLWIASEDQGLFYFNRHDKDISLYTTNQGLRDNRILSLNMDNSNNLWIAINGEQISKLYNDRFLSVNEDAGRLESVFAFLQDKQDRIWMGGIYGLFSLDGTTVTNYRIEDGLSDNEITTLMEDKKGNIWIGTFYGGINIYNGIDFFIIDKSNGLKDNNIRSLLEDQSGNIWIGTPNGISILYHDKYSRKSKDFMVNQSGQDYFNEFKVFTVSEEMGLSNNHIVSMKLCSSGDLIIGTRNGINVIESDIMSDIRSLIKIAKNPDIPLFKNRTFDDGFYGVGVNFGRTFCETPDEKIWICANDRITVYNPNADYKDKIPPSVNITSIELFNEKIDWSLLENSKDTCITLENGSILKDFEFSGLSKWQSIPKDLSLQYDNNYLTFNFIGVTTGRPKEVKYRYKLEGVDKEWSVVTRRSYASYGNLDHGKYNLKIKAMNSDGVWSKEIKYSFEIRPPWWLTWWFRVTYISIAILALIGFYYWRTASLRKRQKQLEEEVKKATAEIRDKNEELLQQQEEILTQRDQIEEQRDELAVKHDQVSAQKRKIEEIHKEVTDSINYAQRIQSSALPDISAAREHLKDLFILFKPKDVVSGDFYWLAKVNNQLVITVADCTGHGVPGAFMSLLGLSMLKEIVVKEQITRPDLILNRLRKEIISALDQTGEEGKQKDGMDMSLCTIDIETKELQWSGANNPCLIVKNGEMLDIKPDKMPIAIYDRMDDFTLHKVSLNKGDKIYLIGDGYPDQFGGPKGKKFMSKKLKKFLLETSIESINEQYRKLEDKLDDWMNNYGERYDQVDDITVMGIEI